MSGLGFLRITSLEKILLKLWGLRNPLNIRDLCRIHKIDNAMDESAAIRKCQEGEPNAFRYVVERYQKQAVSHAMAILINRDDALDASQEAFLDAFRNIRTFDNARPFYPWFYVLLRNRCYKMAARRRELENVDDADIIAAQPGISEEERLTLEKALHSLSDEQREIVTLKYFDGLSYDEIAGRLEIPKGTVMSRLFHARRNLQLKLAT